MVAPGCHATFALHYSHEQVGECRNAGFAEGFETLARDIVEYKD